MKHISRVILMLFWSLTICPGITLSIMQHPTEAPQSKREEDPSTQGIVEALATAYRLSEQTTICVTQCPGNQTVYTITRSSDSCSRQFLVNNKVSSNSDSCFTSENITKINHEFATQNHNVLAILHGQPGTLLIQKNSKQIVVAKKEEPTYSELISALFDTYNDAKIIVMQCPGNQTKYTIQNSNDSSEKKKFIVSNQTSSNSNTCLTPRSSATINKRVDQDKDTDILFIFHGKPGILNKHGNEFKINK